MPTVKGTKFSEEHVRALVESRRQSPAWQAGRKRAAEKMKGRKPSLAAIAGSLATRNLRSLGLTRMRAPTLWEIYRELHLKRLEARQQTTI